MTPRAQGGGSTRRRRPTGTGPRLAASEGQLAPQPPEGPPPAERERIRRAFLGMALSHELKQPLHSLNLNVELLAKRVGKLGADANKGLQLDAPLNALGRVVDRISERLDAFAVRVAPAPVSPTARDLRPVLEDAVARARRAGVPVLLDAPRELPGLPLDVDQLAVALDALLANAVQATLATGRKGSKVVVCARPAGEELRLEVIDQGVGMSADVARRAFEIGFSTWGRDGTGLTVAKFVAYHHSGGFSVTSAEGEGTTVTMVLPLAAEGDA